MTVIGILFALFILLLFYVWVRRMRHAGYSGSHIPIQSPFLRPRLRVSTAKELEEDLLKYFYSHPGAFDATALAERYFVSPERIQEVVDTLLVQKLLSRDDLQLTPPGVSAAEALLRRHRLYESYLSERTGLPPSEWHDIAERMEHRLSEQQTEQLARRLGYPSHDPHGDPILPKTAPTASQAQTRLAEIHTAGWYEVVQMEDKQKTLFETLDRLGFYPSCPLRWVGELPSSVTLFCDGEVFSLPRLLAEQLYVTPLETPPPDGVVRLSALPVGVEAQVLDIAASCHGANRRRLLDLGFVPGSAVSVDLESPLGNPTAYLIRGTTIALRSDQARHIRVIPTLAHNISHTHPT